MKTRIITMALTATGALALAGTVLAQSVPAQFVVSGTAAEKLQDFTTINLATAERIALACERLAQDAAPISVTVWDNDGNEVYMDRMDGQDYSRIITAEQKARTALADRASSKLRMSEVVKGPLQAELQSYQLGTFPLWGGLPIVVNKQMIGVIGVGGANERPGFNNEICAHKALTTVIGPSVAPLAESPPPLSERRRPPVVPVPKFLPTMTPKTTLPAEWVVGGKDAADILDGYQISLAAAKKVARVCRDWASAHNGGASTYIIDVRGNFVHMERMDGQVYNDVRTALLKAQTSLKIGEPTSMREARNKNNPAEVARSTVWFNIYAVSGGMPIVVDGQMIGAMGVSGGAGGGDENCAIEGLKATFGDRVALPVYPQPAANKPG